MKKFFLKGIVFVSIFLFLSGTYLYVIYRNPELVDEAYYKFTTPRASSLIIGTSRSAVGIVPSILNEKLLLGEQKIINHSFTFGTSNYGPRYLQEIKQKLNPNVKNGLFIVSVDPWALSIDINAKDDTSSFIEIKNSVFVGGLKSSSVNPNFEYLKKYWGNRFSPIVQVVKRSTSYENQWVLQHDGWMEINVPCDSFSVSHRLELGLSDYSKTNVKLSETRFQYLEKIINYLQKRGSVVLVRLPVTSQMKKLENISFPDFEKKIFSIAKKNQVPYFNYFERDDYAFVDVHHLEKNSAIRLSQQLCDSIYTLKR